MWNLGILTVESRNRDENKGISYKLQVKCQIHGLSFIFLWLVSSHLRCGNFVSGLYVIFIYVSISNILTILFSYLSLVVMAINDTLFSSL